jgi:hypothetical protein
MEIDHVFMLVSADSPIIHSTGLIETYRRLHQGQGTQNICFCFENLFLEMLWVNNQAEATREAIGRTKLYERSKWLQDPTVNPFGIAWRKNQQPSQAEVPTWDFAPPYLPLGLVIPVATDSDDLSQPMMFQSPGHLAPAKWPSERRGNLQRSIGLGTVRSISLTMPAFTEPGHALRFLAKSTELAVISSRADDFAIELDVDGLNGGPGRRIGLSTKQK